MKLNLKVAWIRKLKSSSVSDIYRLSSDEHWRDVDIEELNEADLDMLLGLMEKSKEIKGTTAIKQKINTYRKLLIDAKGTKVTKLEVLEVAIKALLMPTPHKWLFSENDDGFIVPWYVFHVEYEKTNRHYSPACTQVSMAAWRCGRKITKHINFHVNDLGASAYELLHKKGFLVETKEAVAEYVKGNERYRQICGLTGEQFLATGIGYEKSEWYSDTVTMECDGMPSRVVMDDESDEGNIGGDSGEETITSDFWVGDRKKRGEDENIVELPLQTYVKVFDLTKHAFVVIHVANLTEYKYDAEIIHKLVLPPERKELVAMLVSGADLALEDIVKGKTGGIIVVCTGPPGTGKTLTAEVFSEEVKRPLYNVQCSQLGVDAKELEEELKKVLSRSQRWRAILLIDEADVYIHERGTDINQNGIVGVFLRVLEYYRGVLFMTSNRDTIIDDAIMNRATAWIKYEIPNRDLSSVIWRVLNEQYRANLDEAAIGALVNLKKFTGISGRSIKALLKLARLLSIKKKEPVSVDSIEYVSQFLDLETVARD